MPRYHSQIGQDYLLDTAVFQGMTGGVFVDIGAHDGETFSNSLMFERDRGWAGLCIEPNPVVFPKLAARRKATCLNVAVGTRAGRLNFTLVSGTAEMLSGLTDEASEQHKQRIRREVRASGGDVTVLPVVTQTPAEIFERHKLSEIHYLSVDTEGGEDGILAALPSTTFVHVVDVECDEAGDVARMETALGPQFVLATRHRHDAFFIHRDSPFASRRLSLMAAAALQDMKLKGTNLRPLRPSS